MTEHDESPACKLKRLIAAAPRLPEPPRVERPAAAGADARSHGLLPLPHPIWGAGPVPRTGTRAKTRTGRY